MVSFARYIMILIITLVFVTSNVALSAVHATKPSHLGTSHSAVGSTAKDAIEHQHHAHQQTALDGDARSANKHHSDNSASGCCAFACGGAVISSQVPNLLPLVVASRMRIRVSDSVRATDQSPHDRPPRPIESLAD